MATTGVNWPTLADWAKRTKPDGSLESMIAELLSRQSSILEDAPALPGNEKLGHRETMRTALPTTHMRRFNRGTPTGKSRTSQVTDNIAMYESRSEVDKMLAMLNGNSETWRMTEDAAFIESMRQALVRDLFYGNHVDDPDQISGIATRLSSKTAENIGKQILDAGGTTGKLTSIYLIGWSDRTVNLRYPPEASGMNPITTQDLGELDAYDADGNRFRALGTLFNANLGLSVKDYRYMVRIANIPVDTLDNDGTTTDLWTLLTKAAHLMHSLTDCRPYFYMNRTIAAYLDVQAQNKKNVRLTPVTVDGITYPQGWRNIAFRTEDAITDNEERVV